MFTKEIRGLQITNEDADSVFENIVAAGGDLDESFLATLRIVLSERLPSNENMILKVGRNDFTKTFVETSSSLDLIHNVLCGAYPYSPGNAKGLLYVFSLDTVDDETRAAAMKKLCAAEFIRDNYTELDDLTKFFEQKKQLAARFFVSETKRNAMIFVERLTLKKWHLLQSLIPRYFPWYFKDKPLTEDEVALLKTLTQRDAPAYEELVAKFAEKIDFRGAMIRRKLKGFETVFERKELETTRRNLQSTRNNIDNYLREINNLSRKLEELTTKEFGLLKKIEDGGGEEGEELVRFFTSNKNLRLDEVYTDEGSMYFTVLTTIGNYDPDMFASMIKLRGSCFFKDYFDHNRYSEKNPDMSDDRIYKLMNAILADELLKLRVCAKYYISFSNREYKGMRHHRYPADVLATYTPNQHIQEYACLGDNIPYIVRAINDHDYITAVTMCQASAACMNLSEANTVTLFMREITNKNVGKIIEMPDGSCMTPLDAVKWLEEKEKENEHE